MNKLIGAVMLRDIFAIILLTAVLVLISFNHNSVRKNKVEERDEDSDWL